VKIKKIEQKNNSTFNGRVFKNKKGKIRRNKKLACVVVEEYA